MSHKITSDVVRADFNDLTAVMHYTKAAHELGLWKSERVWIERAFPNREVRLLEAGCGAGRVTLGLWEMGFRQIVAFDFAQELVDQAHSLAAERSADAITFVQADATTLRAAELKSRGGRKSPAKFDGALFMFNGLMQIPGREHRRTALRRLHARCKPGAPLIFTTHDRDSSPTERALWRLEAERWRQGLQDPRLVEFGDRYFSDDVGRTFMHLPDRAEILEDLAATGWQHEDDAMRADLAAESRAVKNFSDECRFWRTRAQ